MNVINQQYTYKDSICPIQRHFPNTTREKERVSTVPKTKLTYIHQVNTIKYCLKIINPNTIFLFPGVRRLNRIPAYISNKSSSSSHPPFRRVITIFCSSSFRCDSATAFNSSFNWSSVTFCRNCPVCASMINRFSISIARDSLTSRMRPSRSAAAGSRIWLRIVARRSAVHGD